MRLKISRVEAEERLSALLNTGYELRRYLWADYVPLRDANGFDPVADNKRYSAEVDNWGNEVIATLKAIFPTQLEMNLFADEWSWASVIYKGIDQKFGRLYNDTLPTYLSRLQKIIESGLSRYTDLPIRERLFVEDIDSFRKVRDVNPALVAHALSKGRLDRSEEAIQMALEQILDVPVHSTDWGGEYNDLYTANVIVNGARTETACCNTYVTGSTVTKVRVYRPSGGYAPGLSAPQRSLPSCRASVLRLHAFPRVRANSGRAKKSPAETGRYSKANLPW